MMLILQIAAGVFLGGFALIMVLGWLELHS